MTLPAAYDALGLNIQVKLTPESLRKAYRAKCLSEHPDTKFGPAAKRAAEEKMSVINEAHELLEKALSRSGPTVSLNPFGSMPKAPDEHQLEARFQEDVIAAWEAIGALVLKVHGNAFQKAGWPDLQIYHPKWTGHLELKVQDNQPSTIQQMVIRDLMARKTWAYVLRWKLGYVYLEDEQGRAISHIEKDAWKTSKPLQRAHLLLALLGAQR
jgi:hypothetical protein